MTGPRAPQGSARLPQQADREDENDRRSEPRSSGCALRSISARIRGGREITVIDVSASGALIAGARPLRPGARVEMHLTLDKRHVIVAAHVTRCLVAAIDADRGITYHSALAFEGRFDWPCEGNTLLVSSMHEVCSA
jgi:hypothetical protein